MNRSSGDKRYMKPVRIIFASLLCGIVVSTVRADIASVQWVQSIITALEPPESVQPDWSQTNEQAADYILHKPTIPSTAADVGAVPTSRQINGNPLSADVTLDGADIVLTGYSKPNATGVIATSDTINSAIGKLEKGLDGKQDKLDATANTGNIKGMSGITVTTPTSGDDAGKVVITGPTLATVATSGAYSDLTGTPTIPTVNDSTLTIQKNGTTIDTFTANAAADKTINITVPTTAADVSAVAATQATKGGILTTNASSGAVEVSSTIAASKVSGLATVATTGAYSDLTGTPTIPTVNDSTLTIQKNGTTIDTFTANAAANKTINITMSASDVGLGNVQNVDQTNASNLTSGTVAVGRLPVGTTSTTVAAGNDARFDTIPTSQPSGTPPTGQVFIWFN